MALNVLAPAYSRFTVLLACLFLFARSNAQQVNTDTLQLSLDSAEKIFLDSNLQLLAGHYNVDADQALIQQAKVWDNPMLVTDQVIAADGKFLPYGKNSATGAYSGQYFIQLQQLIRTAGKRGKLIDLATTNTKISSLELRDLLRNLRYQLYTDYYTLQQQLNELQLSKNQLFQIEKLLTGMQVQLTMGNIAQKDFLRVQALQISLQQDITDLQKSISDTQAEMRTLLHNNTATFLKPDDIDTAALQTAVPPAETLLQLAQQNNPNFLLQQTQVTYQQQNLTYQKALKAPDLTVGPEFDRNSSFAPNYVGLSISLPLPVFNKNQGNIRSAGFNVKQQQALADEASTELYNSVLNAYQKLQLTLQQNSSMQASFYNSYKTMFGHVLQSYQQKQIGLLEFLDFVDTYKDAQLRLQQQQLNLQLSKAELNYQVGTDVIR